MKKILIMLGCFIAMSGAMADDSTDTNVYMRRLVAEMQNAMENADYASMDSDAQSYADRIKNMQTDKQQVYKLLFLSERLLLRVYDDYVAFLEQKSIDTGRENKISESDEDGTRQVTFILDDTGVVDDKCVLQDLCDYPDGYEECFMELTDYGDVAGDDKWGTELFVSCDDKK